MPAPTHTTVVFIKRKEGMSLADFYHYWETVHGPLAKPWAEKYGLTYKQVQVGSQPPTGGGAEALAKYDGYAVFEYSDPDVIKAAFDDADFKRDVSPDQVFFIQEQLTVTSAGKTVTIV